MFTPSKQPGFRLSDAEILRLQPVIQRLNADNIKDLLFKLLDAPVNTDVQPLLDQVQQLQNTVKQLESVIQNHEQEQAVRQSEVDRHFLISQQLRAEKAEIEKQLEDSNGMLNIEKEYAIHPNHEQKVRLRKARMEVAHKHRIVYNNMPEFLMDLIDIGMNQLRFKFKELSK